MLFYIAMLDSMASLDDLQEPAFSPSIRRTADPTAVTRSEHPAMTETS